MQNTRIHSYIAGALALIALAAIALYLSYFRTPAPTTATATTTATTTANASTTTTIDGVQISGSGTIKETTPAPAPKAPAYKTPLSFSASVSTDVREALTKQWTATVAAISKNSVDFDAWVNLGILRKMAGDYQGAQQVWSYVAALYPSSTVPFDNLGNLYLDFLKDYPKAETNFKHSIALDAHDINAYQQLFSLYTIYGYKAGTSAAADLVAAGLKANPGNETLLQLQSQLK